MPGTKGMTPKLQKKMEEIMEELGMMSPRIKPVKKKDGGLMEAIEKVKAKGMKDGGDVAKPKMRPKSLKADKTEIINEEFSKKVARQNAKNKETGKANLKNLPGSKESLKDNDDIFKKVKKMEKGGMAPRRAQQSPMRAMNKLDDAVEEFIETIEPFQGTVRKGETLRNIDGKTMVVRRMPNPNAQSGRMISDRDRAMVGAMLGEGGRMISDADRRMVSQMMGARRMEDGGVVPAKFKGFSKLPEDVQQKMNPTLAKKFKKGGPVKMGSGGGVCRGMGAARAGGKFKLR
jgi:hypothetical protein